MFNIPNAADAEDVSQAQPDSRDFHDIIAQAFAGTGVVTGCAVTAQGAPNMTVAVAAGSVSVAGVITAVTGGNVTIIAADATNPRFDLICVDNTGAKSSISGFAAAAPVFPDPAGKVVLASVRVPAGAASINSSKIVDKRLTAVVVPATEATGVIKSFAGSAAPAGYLLCNGAAVSRTTYGTLYALIGNTYGAGDGSTTFNVPDGQGRTLVGVGTNTDVNALGASDGLVIASRSPKHNSTNNFAITNGLTANHNLTLPDHLHGPGSLSGNIDATNIQMEGNYRQGNSGGAMIDDLNNRHVTISGNTDNPMSHPAVNGAVSLGGSIGISGGIGPGGTRPGDTPAFLVVNYIIKT